MKVIRGVTSSMKAREYKFQVGELTNKSLMIVEQILLPKKDGKAKNGYSNQKAYKFRCVECGYESEAFEYMLVRGNNCPCCINKVIIPEINSIIAKEETKWMEQYFINKEEAKLYSPKSGKSIDARCPYCHEEKKIIIQSLYECKSIGCLCSSGSSFGEKLVRNLLDNLTIQYIEEYTPKWFGLGLKRYDFYLPEYNIIIEVHGSQHYPSNKKQWTTYEEVHQNDIFKFDMAVINGIENYIVIDASKSDIVYIKNSIANSKLPEIVNFDVEDIDWGNLFIRSGNTIIKDVCEYYKKTKESPNEISKKFNLSKSTINSYLKFGNSTGLCEYDPVKACSQNGIKQGHIQGIRNGKAINVYKDGNFMGRFRSMSELERVSIDLFGIKLIQSRISYSIKNKNVYHGFTFELSENN